MTDAGQVVLTNDDRAVIAGAVELLQCAATDSGFPVYAETARKLWNVIYPGMEAGVYPPTHPFGKSRTSAVQET